MRSPLSKLSLFLQALLFSVFFLKAVSTEASERSDSLFKALERTERGANVERIEILLSIGRALYPNHPDSAMAYVDRAEKWSIEIDHRDGLIGSANLKGVIHYVQGEYHQALPYFQRVLAMKKDKGKPLEIANIRNNSGLLQQKLGAYGEALKQHQEAYRIRDSLNDQRGVAESCNNLGIVHYHKENMDRAQHYYGQALRIKKENGWDKDLQNVYNNLGMVHLKREKEEKALKLYHKALSLANRKKDKHKKANYMTNIGDAHRARKEWDSASYYYRKAKRFYQELGDQDGIIGVLLSKGKMYYEKGLMERALATSKKAYRSSDSLGTLRRREKASDLLAKVCAETGKHEKAYRYLRINRDLHDSILQKEEENHVATIEAKFQARQRVKKLQNARQEAEMKKTRALWITGGAGSLLLLVAAFLFYAYHQKKKSTDLLADQKDEIRKQKEEKELLLQELHHRVKNNLQLILSLLNLQTGRIKDPEALEIHKDSQNRVRSMGLLHEKMYHLREVDRNQFEQFVRDLSEHLLETYGMEERIDLQLHIDAEGMGTKTLTPVALILNELLSNALKYGFNKGASGWIVVRIEPEDQDHYVLEVKDNGSGFGSLKSEEEEQNYGLDIVHSLADQLEGELRKKEQESGACLQVYFKNVD